MSKLDLKRILARCTEDGDCLIWGLRVHPRTGSPVATEFLGGQNCYVAVRRRAYEEYHGVTLTDADKITTCGNPGCLAKGHLEKITASEATRRMHAGMNVADKIRRGQNIARNVQQAKGKLTPEQVAAVLASEEGPYVIAKKLGINGVVASRIKRGLSYKNYAASPFAGLGA